jgi:glycosyltransferase involved in cell wall biosynthesis
MNEAVSDRVTATIILPTHGDRAAVLDYSIPSVLNQTVSDLELIVIGDGVDEKTRARIQEFVAADPRVEFVDKPKHKRRGEPYRHEVLQRARGRIVCYLCDRDMMLDDHVERMDQLLTDHDFAHTARVQITKDDILRHWPVADLTSEAGRTEMDYGRVISVGIPLSCGAHTLDAYYRLTPGWQTTPPGYLTDTAMWWKFLRNPTCKAIGDNEHVTVLRFSRKPNSEWPSERRAEDLARWQAKMQDPGWRQGFNRQIACLVDSNIAVAVPPKRGLVQRLSLRRRLLLAQLKHLIRETIS